MRRPFAFLLPLLFVLAPPAACSVEGSGTANDTVDGGNAGGAAGASSGGDSAGGASAGGSSGASAGGSSGDGAGGSSAGSAGASTGGSTGSGGAGGSTGGSLGLGGTITDAGGGRDVDFNYDPPDVGAPDACATGSAEAELLPVDMYIILDRSGSMTQPLGDNNPAGDCNVGQSVGTRWCNAINALHGFFTQPSSVGMGVAFQTFGGGCPNPLTTWTTPAVPYNVLPAHVTQLQMALNNAAPNGGTPTEAAIRGLTGFTAANQIPGRQMVGILITDGNPNGCDENINNLANLISNHYSSTQIPIFVIGMDGATFANLETMAQNGGAQPHTNFCGGGINPCRHYDVGNGDPNAFVQALQQIQQSAIGCTYNMPVTDAGLINPDLVDVVYRAGGTGAPQTIPRVNDATACAAGGGWYYDNNFTPTTITLCPDTCTVVAADPNARIDIELGCLGS